MLGMVFLRVQDQLVSEGLQRRQKSRLSPFQPLEFLGQPIGFFGFTVLEGFLDCLLQRLYLLVFLKVIQGHEMVVKLN